MFSRMFIITDVDRYNFVPFIHKYISERLPKDNSKIEDSFTFKKFILEIRLLDTRVKNESRRKSLRESGI